MAPVYVTFMVPQRTLPGVRQALAAESATVEALIPGDTKHAHGQVTMIENTVDSATGMVAIRATMPNEDELLWPGTLVTTQLTLRTDQAVTVPSAAIQVSQTGNFVFVVKDNVATVRPVKVARTVGHEIRHRKRPGGRRDRRHRWPTVAEQWDAGGAARAEGRLLT